MCWYFNNSQKSKSRGSTDYSVASKFVRFTILQNEYSALNVSSWIRCVLNVKLQLYVITDHISELQKMGSPSFLKN